MAIVSEQLVDLASEIRFANLPGAVIREAGKRLLDALGCMIAGANGATTQQVRMTVARLGGNAESSILGTREFTSCEKASVVNSTALRFLDYMDGHPGPYPCHACFNIPPILAVAESVGACGAELITAIVRAYEIMPRFQEHAAQPDLGARGWAGSTHLAFSVPLGIAPLLGLNKEQTINALGISATHGGVLDAASHGQMPTSKSLLDGMTAMNAVVAALLAKQGVSGPPEVIDGKGGYVMGIAGSCDYAGLLTPIGRHRIMETYTKLYNTVKCGQTAVGAALQLKREYQFSAPDLVDVRIGLARRDAANQTRHPSYARPANRDTANHSVRFCVAASLVDGEVTAEQFAPEKLRAPEILSMVDRTAVYWDEAQEAHWPLANPATITIRTRGGLEVSKTLVFPPGHPNNPLPDELLEQKFRQLTGETLDAEQVETIIGMTRRLDRLRDVRVLMSAMRPRSKS